jgi:polar amino acid transport system substrate-binding protein
MSRQNPAGSWRPVAAASLLLAALALGGAALRPLLAAQPQAVSLPQTLRVGVPAGALRYANGLRDYTGDGLEPAFAQELVAALGTELELVSLPHGGAAQALKDGRVDVALVRDGAAFAGVALLPTALRSGVSVAMRSDTPVRQWSDLSGRVLCAAQGPVRAWQASGGGPLRLFTAPAQALVAVRTGECDAVLLDHAQLSALLQRSEWRKFSATLPPLAAPGLSVLVRADLSAVLRQPLRGLDGAAQWQRRARQWAANVAFEVYFDQTGPDCH